MRLCRKVSFHIVAAPARIHMGMNVAQVCACRVPAYIFREWHIFGSCIWIIMFLGSHPSTLALGFSSWPAPGSAPCKLHLAFPMILEPSFLQIPCIHAQYGSDLRRSQKRFQQPPWGGLTIHSHIANNVFVVWRHYKYVSRFVDSLGKLNLFWYSYLSFCILPSKLLFTCRTHAWSDKEGKVQRLGVLLPDQVGGTSTQVWFAVMICFKPWLPEDAWVAWGGPRRMQWWPKTKFSHFFCCAFDCLSLAPVVSVLSTALYPQTSHILNIIHRAEQHGTQQEKLHSRYAHGHLLQASGTVGPCSHDRCCNR